MTFSEELDLLLNKIQTIPNEKKYWFIRTQSGSLYDTFIENKFVALEHNELFLNQINDIHKQFGDDKNKIYKAIRNSVRSVHEKLLKNDETLNKRNVSLVASQIYKFVFEVKQDDVIIIPSYNSDFVSFGIVKEDYIGSFTKEEIIKSGIETLLKRRVEWVNHTTREKLDPYLNRIFTAHQAINDIGKYSDIIERSVRDFYVLNDEAHLIINIQTDNEIPASDLFGMGYGILKLIDEFAIEYSLDISSNDLQVKINLNSPGKIDLKSKIKKTTFIAAILLFVVGGGYKGKYGNLNTSGLINVIDDFLTRNQERSMRQQIFDKYKDSLNIKTPDDMVKLLKQVSENKDVPH